MLLVATRACFRSYHFVSAKARASIPKGSLARGREPNIWNQNYYADPSKLYGKETSRIPTVGIRHGMYSMLH